MSCLSRLWLLLVAALLGGCAAVPLRAPETGRSIDSLERISLGGVRQAIWIRGDDVVRNPVLLFVHGGPGLPEMPLAHRNAALETSFTVVQWDQRGTGKSYRFGTPGLTAEQILADTLDLSRLLVRRFGGRKIYLVGFSWGSLIAARAVAREPGLYAAYVGVSQVVDLSESERVLYSRALEKARERGWEQARQDLLRGGPPPWKDPARKKLAKRWWPTLEEPLPRRMTSARFASLALTSPVYTPLDYLKVPFGARASNRALIPEIYRAHLLSEIRQLDVPCWFVVGRHDTVVSGEVQARWIGGLRAPRGKRLVWFEESAHAPHLEESPKYREVLRRVRQLAPTSAAAPSLFPSP